MSIEQALASDDRFPAPPVSARLVPLLESTGKTPNADSQALVFAGFLNPPTRAGERRGRAQWKSNFQQTSHSESQASAPLKRESVL
ncbi:MAG TPA: hypothetical protein VIN35_03370 [Hydrogenophaga sp.]